MTVKPNLCQREAVAHVGMVVRVGVVGKKFRIVLKDPVTSVGLFEGDSKYAKALTLK